MDAKRFTYTEVAPGGLTYMVLHTLLWWLNVFARDRNVQVRLRVTSEDGAVREVDPGREERDSTVYRKFVPEGNIVEGRFKGLSFGDGKDWIELEVDKTSKVPDGLLDVDMSAVRQFWFVFPKPTAPQRTPEQALAGGGLDG